MQKIKPSSDYILVKLIERAQETKSDSGILLPNAKMNAYEEGEVIAVGPGTKTINGETIPIDVNPGDKILFTKYGAIEIEKHLLIKELNILATK